MLPTLALLHTTAVTLPVLAEAARAELGDSIRVVNLLDDSLLADVVAAGEVTGAVEARLRAYVDQAAVIGASAIMSACSSIGSAMERIGDGAPLPVWRIDEAMAEEAALRGTRIGVLGTVQSTMDPTTALIERFAAGSSRPVAVVSAVVEGAFDALRAGDRPGHDDRVRRALDAMAGMSDLIVLAQVSTARVAAGLRDFPVPILTSPVSGLRRARERLAALGGLA